MAEPLTITNFGGPLTRRNTGEINSGLAKYATSWGYDPYSKPGNLTWMEQPTSILTGASTTDTIIAMKARTEGALQRVYALNAVNTLYKISVNGAENPSLDSPSVIGTIGTGAHNRGTGIEFYGATEKIFIGTDSNVQKVNFDGSSASIIGTLTSDVPRPIITFLGKLYIGNGNNIAEVDSTETFTSTAKLSPALPSGLFVRDLDLTPDGNYLQILASRTNAQDPTGANLDPYASFSADSYRFYWNGIDDSFSAMENYSGITLSANASFGESNYMFGYDTNGSALFRGPKKIASLPTLSPVSFNSTFSHANILGFAAPEYDTTTTTVKATIMNYGQYDAEVPSGLFRLLRHPAQIRTDYVGVPVAINVSNLLYSPSVAAFSDNISGVSKIYYSTQEDDTNGAATQKLWKFSITPVGLGSVVAGVYETQNQIFSKKVKLGEVRFYTEPLVADNAFTLAVLNSGSSIIAQNTYTVGSNVTAGEDLIRFTPQIAPTQAVGFRITNSGSKNWTGLKLEADVDSGGS